MQIHVVSSGETLFSIARQYDVPAGILARYNGLAEPYRLAVGQSLLILRPTSLVTVRAGDTLSSLAQQNGQPVRSLLRLNPNLTQQTAIYPGQIVVTAIEDAPEREAVVFGYAYPYVSPSVLAGILPYAGGLAPFTYGFTEDGTLVPLDDTALLAQAAEIGTAGVMHLSTLTERGTFSAERAAALLENEAAQETLIANVVTDMAARGYQALDVDFEYLGAPLAAAYAAFLGKLRAAVNASGWPLLAALAPKTSREQAGTLYEGHDYAAVAANTDAVLLMTYEWGYTYGPPMAVAPVPSVRRVVEFALTEMPPEKIFLGFPNYAYDWTLPYAPGTTRAQSIGNEAAVQLAVNVGAEIRFDEQAETPWFAYTDGESRAHEVWFEDARSSLAKYRLVTEYGLCGIGYWNFMRPFTAGFALLNAVFRLEPQSAARALQFCDLADII